MIDLLATCDDVLFEWLLQKLSVPFYTLNNGLDILADFSYRCAQRHSVYKKISYRKQVARQHSCHKNLAPETPPSKAGWDVGGGKKFPLT